jgi:hypothetical protein
MYYKLYLPCLGKWAIYKKVEGQPSNRCIVSNIEEIDCNRLLVELGEIIELPIKRAPRYRLTMFKDGWAVFLDSQDLPGGTLMIRGGMITDEMVTLLATLKKALQPEELDSLFKTSSNE